APIDVSAAPLFKLRAMKEVRAYPQCQDHQAEREQKRKTIEHRHCRCCKIGPELLKRLNKLRPIKSVVWAWNCFKTHQNPEQVLDTVKKFYEFFVTCSHREIISGPIASKQVLPTQTRSVSAMH